jgi:Ulp1 family protease
MLIISGRWLGDEFESKSGHADGYRQDASVTAQPKKKKSKQDLTDKVDESGRCQDDKFDASEWKVISPHNPMQTNGFDCGVFIVLFMDLLMLGVPLLFGAEDVSLMRKKLTLQILNARAESARKVVDVD